MRFHLRLYLPNEPKPEISRQLTPNSFHSYTKQFLYLLSYLVPAHLTVWNNQIPPRLSHSGFQQTIWLMKQFFVIMFSVVPLHWFIAAAGYESFASAAESFMESWWTEQQCHSKCIIWQTDKYGCHSRSYMRPISVPALHGSQRYHHCSIPDIQEEQESY